MSYFTIIRHGQTTSNQDEIIHSGAGGELTKTGILMAKTLGQYLHDEKFTHVYASDYTRAVDTTINILGQLKPPVPQIIKEPLLRERDVGNWEMKPMSLLYNKLKELNLPIYKIHTLDLPGCEKLEDCKKRCAKFFTMICKLVDDAKDGSAENILVVSHSWFIFCFVDFLRENPSLFKIENLKEDDIKVNTENTCRTRFSIGKMERDGKRTLTFTHIYDVTHLK